MRQLIFFAILFFALGSLYAQPDTVVIETGSQVKTLLTSQIDSITFSWRTNRAMLMTGTENEKKIDKPDHFTLSQNYPNPFNPTTRINCYIPSTGKVRVRIFNINGSLIKEIYAGEKEKGQHVFMWDGKNNHGSQVASGVYLFNIRFDNLQSTKKIILLK